ncbi:agmatine deiminase [Nannocystis exedens]|uniref:Agmatine deiminase n=1 Tax=Nannocystis exedens TaxID=54 RepID=A0A1I1XD62_9BACT|nr:agmatine deiminase family protein [Nannocystis exedens]PCC70764.1 agmatine deiminase [Nannocystis exedens]SFE03310.1 agmatine deiminase [Nannocystis exedens]
MKHPRINHPLNELTESAAELGYRMPAEWEPLSSIWLARPHNPTTWPGCLAEAQAQHADFAAAVRRFVPVRMLGESISIATDDAWIRDYGPIFVKRKSDGALALHDFHFNNWGGKYGDCANDDVVPQKVALLLSMPVWIHDFVLEGGSIEVNGVGTVMTSESCLFHPGRNANLGRADIERELHAALGTTHAIWLPAGIAGDDTDGHIDDLARFVAADTIAAVRAPQGHPDHEVLERNWEALTQARDQNGQKLQLVELPAPAPIFWDFPPEDDWPGGVRQVPASYANFLFANRAVLVPTFEQPTDEQALKIFEQLFPDRVVVPVPAKYLVVGLGSLHCLSQQQPF